MTLGWFFVIAAAFGGIVMLVYGSRGQASHQIWRELGLAISTGAVVGAVMIPITSALEDRRFDREQSLEDERVARQARLANLTFVRETLASGDAARRFDRLDLADLPLNNLALGYASFVGADLSGADLRDSNIFGADFEGALLNGTIFGFDDTPTDRNNPNYVPPVENGGSSSGRWEVPSFGDAFFGNVCWVEDDPPLWPEREIPPESAEWCRE